jgi:hypothetical protein
MSKVLHTHPSIQRNFAIVCIIIFVGWFCSYTSVLHADPWKCGTPLLIERSSSAIDFNLGNGELVLAAPAAPAQLGQIDRFFIHIPETSIKATCVAVGAHCYIYIDNTVQDMLPKAEADKIANTFDTNIYPKVHHWIGSEFQPGLDRDNRITILFHDVGMNASGADYGGYFSPTDQHPTYPTSNRRDMLYMDIFQFKERSRHTFYSSLTHEFAHLVNWYQNGGKSDQRWLEEGIASFTEWGIYGTVHTLFVDGYLADPSISLTTANNNDTYYGAAFMLMLYLYENHGGINFVRQLAAEDTLGLPAIDLTLGKDKHFVDAFLNWGIANWLNNPRHGKHLSYLNLPNRKITARTPRITRYPTTSADIPIDSWGVEYVLLQNLPDNLELTLKASTQAHLHANIVYLASNTNGAVVKPILSVSDPNVVNAFHTNKIEISNLSSDGQILLIVTSEYPQTFRYIAKPGVGDDSIDIGKPNGVQRNIEQSRFLLRPNSVTYLPNSNSQPISLGHRVGTALIATNISTQLEPMSQIHLSSNYNEIVIQEDSAFATSDWGLEIFTLNPSPARIGGIATPGNAQAIVIDGDNAYIADGESGVHLIEVNPLTSPRIVKTLGGFHDARDVHLANGNLYTLDTGRGLLVFKQQDVLNNENPHPRRTFKTAGTPFKVSTNDEGKVYISDNAKGLYILALDPLGGFTVTGTVPLLALDFEVLGKYALLVSSNLRILDIGAALAPEPISWVNTPGLTSAMTFYEGLLYLTDQQAGLHIVNVNSPQRPRLISSHPTIGNAEDVELWYSAAEKATYAYVADGKGGIQTLDVTEPDMPVWINHYNASGTAYGLDVVSDGDKTTIAIADGVGGLKIAELTDLYNGEITQNIRTFAGNQGALCVQIEKLHAFVGTDTGMDIVDVTTEEILTHIPTTDPVWAIAIIGDYAYLCAKSLVVVDIRNPERSQIVSKREFIGSAYKIAYNTSHAYVASLEGGVHILDISEPALPRPIAHFTTEGVATNIALADELVYILDSQRGVLKLDGTEPQRLTPLSNYVETQLPIAAAIQGNYLYLLDSQSVQIIDSRTMRRRARYALLRSPTDLAVLDSALYVTDLFQLSIFRVNTNQLNLAVEEPLENRLDQPILSTISIPNQLLQNYPNPFNPETWIPYSLAKGTHVSLSIHDANGHLVSHQLLGFKRTGKHTVHWNGRNAIGEPVASGIYFYTLNAGDFSATRKMVVQH